MLLLGVYKYSDGKWEKCEPKFENGIHVVYFGNNKCGACRLFDVNWELGIKKWKGDNISFWIVRCDWFEYECGDATARKLFEEYDINASPTIIIIKDGKVLDKLSGVLTADQLVAWIKIVMKERKVKAEEKKKFTLGYYC